MQCYFRAPRERLHDAFAGVQKAACMSELPSALSQQPGVPAQVSGIVVGEGYRFGYKAQGDTDMLAALCDKHRLKLHVATLLASSTEPESSVSSSKACLCKTSCAANLPVCHTIAGSAPLDPLFNTRDLRSLTEVGLLAGPPWLLCQ